jgi:hypothetical protein
MIGIVKITNTVWNNKKLRRALLRVIKPLRTEEDLYFDLITIKAESKHFTELTPEGSMLPIYDMVFKSVAKKFLFWKYSKIEFSKCTVVKQSTIIPAKIDGKQIGKALKFDRDKFLKRS